MSRALRIISRVALVGVVGAALASRFRKHGSSTTRSPDASAGAGPDSADEPVPADRTTATPQPADADADGEAPGSTARRS
jgi:hypothetical protein